MLWDALPPYYEMYEYIVYAVVVGQFRILYHCTDTRLFKQILNSKLLMYKDDTEDYRKHLCFQQGILKAQGNWI